MNGALELWKSEMIFQAVYKTVKPRTLVDEVRCWVLWNFAQTFANPRMVMAELGVYRGGTARLLCEAVPTCTVQLYDMFAQGMPTPDPSKGDLHREGDFACSMIEVEAFLAVAHNRLFLPGFFPDTAFHQEHRQDDHSRYCFVHVDADIYPSVRAALEFFYPRLHGAMVFDDYGFPSCPGAKAALDEWSQNVGVPFVYLPTGQAVVFRH